MKMVDHKDKRIVIEMSLDEFSQIGSLFSMIESHFPLVTFDWSVTDAGDDHSYLDKERFEKLYDAWAALGHE